MSNAHEIVVYTPMEHALYNSEFTFPVFLAAIVFLVVAVIATRVVQSFFNGYWHHGFRGHVYNFGGLYIAGIVSLFIFLSIT